MLGGLAAGDLMCFSPYLPSIRLGCIASHFALNLHDAPHSPFTSCHILCRLVEQHLGAIVELDRMCYGEKVCVCVFVNVPCVCISILIGLCLCVCSYLYLCVSVSCHIYMSLSLNTEAHHACHEAHTATPTQIHRHTDVTLTVLSCMCVCPRPQTGDLHSHFLSHQPGHSSIVLLSFAGSLDT